VTATLKKVLERTNTPAFLTLFNNNLSGPLFNYSKIPTLVSMVTLLIMVILPTQRVQQSVP